ncbi:transmembrane protein 260 isoform X1 [Tachysurus fulvidraco]|uniref:transmembrane protein 260 isoform X1 n=1 Tax=Tachysurus fulvidraco TaxID=1234273 RepID=UPI001FEF71F6|nr:transmembrane protein 260 isoform X1 [Tachysurus fulvidraco]XP_027028627.2 transmembrane protein 260 isoform X1 [Tachysurus fulvidraco]
MNAKRRCWTLTGATVACVLALYLRHVPRAVAGGDSGELITAACELGVAHPPGYPLFTMLASLALCLVPATSPAHAINMLCAVLGAMASGALCYTVCRMAGPGPGAVLACGSFAVSKLVWQWSLVAEVFSLNNLFVGIIFSLSVCFHNAETVEKKKKFALWGALCCGLSLCNQHTLVVYVVFIIPWALVQLYSYEGLSFSAIVSLGLCFLAGFLPYLYLPISSYLNVARWSWGDQTTLSGLLTHLLRAEYGTFSLAKSEGTVNLVKMLQAQYNHCVEDLSVPVLVFAVLALIHALCNRRCRVFVCLIAVMVSVYSVFFAWRANLDIENPLLLGVVERFWLQADAGVCVLAGVGLNWTVCLLERWLGLRSVWNVGAWFITAGLLSHTIHINQREFEQSKNDVVERFARELIFSFPESSLVLTRGDLPGNTLRYLHYCQGLRPDLSLVDQEMMTYSWYVPKLQQHLSGVKFPGRVWDPVITEQKNSFNIEQFIRHNIHRPVFVCIGLSEGDPSWKKSFSLWPWGVCEQLMPLTSRLHPVEWAQRTQNLYKWSEPHNSFPSGSWEQVANEEMWQARMKMPFFLFDLAERMEGGNQTHLYELSYNLYCQIVNAQKDYPANWDKNLALAAERLLHLEGGQHGLETLLSRSIHHFTRYIEREPSDPQSDAILSAITHLNKERDRLRNLHRETRHKPV